MKARLITAGFIVLAASLLAGVTQAFATWSSEDLVSPTEQLVRLHVVANSDSMVDQSVKLIVRNAIIDLTEPILARAESKQEALNLIERNADLIESVALNAVESCGYDYPVYVETGRYEFPNRIYGSVTVPAGTYDALRVVIGEGEGHNWWCVLFPPLCFIELRETKPGTAAPLKDGPQVQSSTYPSVSIPAADDYVTRRLESYLQLDASNSTSFSVKEPVVRPVDRLGDEIERLALQYLRLRSSHQFGLNLF